jgi:mycothiol system anti-sigma-R factor
MNCHEVQTHAPPYVDGELGIDETAAVQAHLGTCSRCRQLVEGERQFRQLLRRQPRESAPAELRTRVLTRCRRQARRTRLAPWVLGSALGAAAAVLVLAVGPALLRQTPAMVPGLVATHAAYAGIDRPAEFLSTDPREVEAWFRERGGLRVTVADYSRAGIQLVGARLATVEARRAAFVLYEKGRTLLSVFTVPSPGGGGRLTGRRVRYRGQEYVTDERGGYRTVAWADGQTVFALVSLLDYDPLLECADSLRLERANQARL